MSKHHTLSGTDIEDRAWEIAELFRTIEIHAPMAMGNQVSIETLATLGKKLVIELAEYAIGDRSYMLGMEVPITSKPAQHTIDEVLHSYRQTILGAEALMLAISAADLKRVSVGHKALIADAALEMQGHVDAALSDFWGCR